MNYGMAKWGFSAQEKGEKKQRQSDLVRVFGLGKNNKLNKEKKEKRKKIKRRKETWNNKKREKVVYFGFLD